MSTNSLDEIVDLVDEQDRVIGTVRRGEAIKDPKLIHREVAVLIYDDQGRILLQQRSRKKVDSPLYWTVSCAGWVTKGSDPLDEAHKELQEELGFDAYLEFFKKIFRSNFKSEFYYCYKGKYSNQGIVANKDEIEQVRFFSRKGFEKMVKSAEKIGQTSKELIEEFWSLT